MKKVILGLVFVAFATTSVFNAYAKDLKPVDAYNDCDQKYPSDWNGFHKCMFLQGY